MLAGLARMMGLRELSSRDPAEVRTVFLLLFMSVFLIADTMLLAPNISLLTAEFKVSKAQVGLVSTIFILVGAAVSIFIGYFTDRWPRKGLAALTILSSEIPCLLTGYVDTWNELLLVRSLTGIGVGGIYPLIYSMISDLVTERERSAAAAWIGLAEGVGMAAGTLVAGNVGPSELSFLGTSGWRLPFVLAALPNFLLLPLFWLWGKEPRRGGGERALQRRLEEGLQYTRRIKLSDYRVIFTNRTNIFFVLQSIPGTIGWGMLPFWMIDFYADQKGVPIPLATNLMIVVGLGMIAGGFVGGLVGNRLHARKKHYLPLLCGVTTLLGMAGFFVMINYPVPRPAGAGEMVGPLLIGVVAGFFITITSSNIRAIVLNVNPPENRGAMMSIFTLTDSIGKGSMPYLGGLMIGAWGYVAAMNLATASWLLCAFVFLALLTPQYPRDARRLEELMARRAGEMQAAGGPPSRPKILAEKT